MGISFNVPSVVMLISGAILLSFVVSIFRQNSDKCALFLKLLLAAAALWAVSNGLELALSDIWLKVLLSKISYIGVCSVIPLWLLFVLHYVKHPLLQKRAFYHFLPIIPAIVLGFVFTNEFHGLVWPALEAVEADGGIRIIYSHGIMVLIFAIYAAVIMLIGTFMLIGSMNSSSLIIKRQGMLMIVATASPWVLNTVYLLGYSPIEGVDLTPMGFIITGVMFFFGVQRLKILDIMPVARHILFREVSDGVLVIDHKYRIVDINPASSGILGMEEKQLIGRQVEEVIPVFTELLSRTGQDDRIRNACCRLNDKYIDVRISRLADNKQSYGYMTVLRDISILRYAQIELMKAKEEAETANEAKGRFLANVSHEFRTPMNSILGFLELLSGTELDPVQTEYVNDTKIAAETLLSLLNDILDYSRAESGMLQLERIPMDLHMMVRETVSLFEAAARKNGNQLEYSIAENVPVHIYGDPVRLRQVLINLICNAVKFTENGSVTVRVYTHKVDENREMLRFEIKDTGIGMSRQILGKIFQAFAQADTSIARNYGGSGLGLSIAKKIIDLHGGTISVESEPGKGSCFTVSIRLEAAEPAGEGAVPGKSAAGTAMERTATEAAAARPAADTAMGRSAADNAEDQEYDYEEAESNSGGGKESILLVEDMEPSRRLAAILLKKQGYDVDCADNGKTAVEMCDAKLYDLVLMDCQMPVMDGFLAASAIKSGNGMNKGTPIVAMTAYNSESDRRMCRAAGMDDYIVKPVRVEILKEVISKYLDSAAE